MITSKLVNQGFWYCQLCRIFKRFYKRYQLLLRKFGASCKNHIIDGTVELVYSGHPSEAANWLLYTGGLLIEVFNVYVAHGKFRWDFPY